MGMEKLCRLRKPKLLKHRWRDCQREREATWIVVSRRLLVVFNEWFGFFGMRRGTDKILEYIRKEKERS